MGLLRFAETSEKYVLGPRCLLGRDLRCDIPLADPRVSGEHAVIVHDGARFELRDLGSKNGTFVDGRKMGVGDRTALTVGMTFSLGGHSSFELVDGSPPEPIARNVRTRNVRVAQDGMLVLPDEKDPAITVFEGQNGAWVAEFVDGSRPVGSGDILSAGGEDFRLELPTFGTATVESLRAGPSIDSITLQFVVRRGDHAEMTMIHEGTETPFRYRAYHQLLLALARAWVRDADAPPSDRGWVAREDLFDILDTDACCLNVDIYRARGQVGALGVHGAAALIVRRPSTGQLRLGVRNVEVIEPKETRPSLD